MLRPLEIAVALSLAPLCASANEYACTYNWSGESESHPVVIEVTGRTAIERGGYLNSKYQVIEDSKDELIIVQTFTKKTAGSDYPVGATVIALDKATNKMVRSNTFMNESFNHYAVGKCSPVSRK